MADDITLSIGPGGALRAVYDDGYDFSAHTGAPVAPVRGSHVEPIPSGPNAGRWYADMSPLGEDFCFCLWPPSAKREAALAAEKQFINDNWVKRLNGT